MKDFTAELEQVFGVEPSRETGLLIDTFDGADFGSVRACGTTRADDTCACGNTRIDNVRSCGGTCRVSAPHVVGTICRVSVPA